MKRSQLLCASVFGSLSLFACGSSEDPTPSAVDQTMTSKTTSHPEQTGGSDPHGDLSDGDAGIGDAGFIAACSEIYQEYIALTERFQSCTEQVGCKLTTTPSVDDPPFCKGISVSSASDESEFAPLAARWAALGCTIESGCRLHTGMPKCIDNKCTIRTECDLCPTDVDPVCTTSGRNAKNECSAEKCLHSTVASRGFCPDTPACLAKEGTCRESLPGAPTTTPLCLDGERIEGDFLRPICADGEILTTCCVPWGFHCPYLAQPLSLSLDPFTCGPSTALLENTCMHPRGDVTSCEASWSYFLPTEKDDPEATLQVSVGPDGDVNVTGVHRGTGRTFTCTGTVSWDHLAERGSPWRCEACLGTDCTHCTIEQSTPCER